MDEEERESAALHVRERIYVSFATLAVALTLSSHAEDLAAGTAAASLAISAIGTVAAAYVADLFSHIAVHGTIPDKAEGRSMRSASLGAASVIVAPLLALGLSALGLWSVTTALTIGIVILVATLVLVGWLGVRRTMLPRPQKLLLLAVLFALAIAVVALKLLAGH